jgi:hypothetical protein
MTEKKILGLDFKQGAASRAMTRWMLSDAVWKKTLRARRSEAVRIWTNRPIAALTFCHNFHIALKEMRETHYWLSVIDKARLVADTRHLAPLLDEATQLRAILRKCVATARGKARHDVERPNPPPAGRPLVWSF